MNSFTSYLPHILILFALAAVAFVVWMRWRMRVSKGRFAIYTISALVSIFIAYIGFVSTPWSEIILNAVARLTGTTIQLKEYTWATNLAVFFLAVVVCILISRFAMSAIRNWEAPQHLSDYEAARKGQDTSLVGLAKNQFQVVITNGNDPEVDRGFFDPTKEKITPPKAVETWKILRSTFVTCFTEAEIPDSHWRAAQKCWVGEIFHGVSRRASPLILVVFDTPPSKSAVSDRFEEIIKNSSFDESTKLYGAYLSNEKDEGFNGRLSVLGHEVEVFSNRDLILKSLDLPRYARGLISSFDSLRVGGTGIPLASTYVELCVTKKESLRDPLPLSTVLSDWEKEDSRRQLAITGEYGQGKSTAMLRYCCEWAEKFLDTGEITSRVPLLIELRGRNPSESDPLSFISTWCSRYGLNPEQTLNLIKSGDAVVIFEGFDELRNSGRAFDRFNHFKNLWSFSYPNAKLIFTGRPNFFLDEAEANSTLKSRITSGLSGEAYSDVWTLEKLTIEQIKQSCRNLPAPTSAGIFEAAKSKPDFQEIISRPSMLPVVATIWDDIEKLQEQGTPLTGALLIEMYINASFERKEAELERDRIEYGTPDAGRYISLPRPVRELLTMCIAWRMAAYELKNTIPRSEVKSSIADIYENLFNLSVLANISQEVSSGMADFAAKNHEATKEEILEIITQEVCSSGLLVPDPAGGSTNLRFPHKQFFEYLVAKCFCIRTFCGRNAATVIIAKVGGLKPAIKIIQREINAISYLAECVGPNLSLIFPRYYLTFAARWEAFSLWLFYRNKSSSRTTPRDRALIYAREYYSKPITHNANEAFANVIVTAYTSSYKLSPLVEATEYGSRLSAMSIITGSSLLGLGISQFVKLSELTDSAAIRLAIVSLTMFAAAIYSTISLTRLRGYRTASAAILLAEYWASIVKPDVEMRYPSSRFHGKDALDTALELLKQLEISFIDSRRKGWIGFEGKKILERQSIELFLSPAESFGKVNDTQPVK